MISRLFPKEFNFFELFEVQVQYAVEAAKKFKDIVSHKGLLTDQAYKEILEIERKGDDATHAIIDQLNKVFIAPFDREDIYELTKELDDIVDMINTMTNRLKVYKIQGGDKSLMEFAVLIEQSVVHVAAAVNGLRNSKNARMVKNSCIEINRLETAGDSMRDHVLADLFENAKDPVHIIKWKEIYEDAETLLDICEDVANVVESILVKHL